MKHPDLQVVKPAADEQSSFVEQRREEAKKRFDQLYSNWLSARGAHCAPWGDEDDIGAYAKSDAEDEAARLLFITPAICGYQLWKKIEAFEYYLSGDGDCLWTDEREVAFFGCIKADLMKFGIGDKF